MAENASFVRDQFILRKELNIVTSFQGLLVPDGYVLPSASFRSYSFQIQNIHSSYFLIELINSYIWDAIFNQLNFWP